MATRICIIGNSHVACLKTGWNTLRDRYPGMKLTFFASRAGRMSALRAQGTTLVPGNPQLEADIRFTSNGKSSINLAEFDGVLIVGLGLRVPALEARLSAAVIAATASDSLTASINHKLATLVRAACQCPVWIGHTPQKAIAANGRETPKFASYQRSFEALRRALDIPGARLIPQPEITLFKNWNTKLEFSQGSTRLDVGDSISNQPHPSKDDEHMNGHFGAIYLQSLFTTLESPS